MKIHDENIETIQMTVEVQTKTTTNTLEANVVPPTDGR